MIVLTELAVEIIITIIGITIADMLCFVIKEKVLNRSRRDRPTKSMA